MSFRQIKKKGRKERKKKWKGRGGLGALVSDIHHLSEWCDITSFNNSERDVVPYLMLVSDPNITLSAAKFLPVIFPFRNYLYSFSHCSRSVVQRSFKQERKNLLLSKSVPVTTQMLSPTDFPSLACRWNDVGKNLLLCFHISSTSELIKLPLKPHVNKKEVIYPRGNLTKELSSYQCHGQEIASISSSKQLQ